MGQYVAFLRGINVGGNRIIKMGELRHLFESLGLQDVKTVLASGNVMFTADAPEKSLAEKIGQGLATAYGQEISVIIRSIEELESIIKKNPFRDISVTPETRLYVTFFSKKPKSALKIPYSSPKNQFRIIDKSDREVYSVLIVSKDRRTVELMGILEREYGEGITTRNWNTLMRIAKN